MNTIKYKLTAQGLAIGIVLSCSVSPSPSDVCVKLREAKLLDATATACTPASGQRRFKKAEESILLTGPALQAQGAGIGSTELQIEVAAFEGEIVRLPSAEMVEAFRQAKIDYVHGFHGTLGGSDVATHALANGSLLTRGVVAVVLVPTPSASDSIQEINEARAFLVEEMGFKAESLKR